MWEIMECVPCLERSETSAINPSPWKNPLLVISRGKVFVRTVDREKKPKSNIVTAFKNGKLTEPLEDSSEEESVVDCQ